MDDKQDTAFFDWFWYLSVAEHALTVRVASLNHPPCGKRSRYLLPDLGSILELVLMELKLINLELELKFARKKNQKYSYLECKPLGVGIPSRYSEYLLVVKSGR